MTFPVSNRAVYVRRFFTIAIPLVFLRFPPGAEYTPQLRIFFMITVFVLLLTAFDLMEIPIPSVLLPTLYFLSGIVPMNQAFMLILLAMGTICNLFMTPYAMMAALSMPFGTLGIDAGISPIASIMALTMSTDLIFMPYEIAPCLLMYSFGLISMGNFVKFYTFKTAATFAVFICLIWPYWKICGWIS